MLLESGSPSSKRLNVLRVGGASVRFIHKVFSQAVVLTTLPCAPEAAFVAPGM